MRRSAPCCGRRGRAGGLRDAGRGGDLDVAADERGLDPAYAGDGGVPQHDRVLDLAVLDPAALGDGGERADVGVADHRAGADDGGADDARCRGPRRPTSIRTRPMISLASSTVPVDAGLERLQDGAVDLQHVGDVAGVLPVAGDRASSGRRVRWSMSHWMAWVISSSPRQEGSMRGRPRGSAGVKRYTPTRARSLLGCFGFSSRLTTRPLVVELGDTERASGRGPGSAGSAASGRSARNSSTRPVMPPTMKLSPRYITKSSSPRKSRAMRTAWARPSGCVLGDVGDVDTELGAVADGFPDLVGGVADDDPDLGDAGIGDGLQSVEEHGLVGDGHQLLGRCMGDRTQASARATGENKSLHSRHVRPRQGTPPCALS